MSLKNLQEISSVVTNYTKKAPFEGVTRGSKTKKLVEGIVKGAWEKEEDAEFEIYHKALTGRSFDMLQSRAKEQLVNSIFLLDTKKRFKSSYDAAYFSACKNLLAGLILVNRNAQKAGIQHLKLSLSVCQKFHFTDIAIMNLRLLRYLVPFFQKKSKFTELNSLLKDYTKKLEADLLSEELNQDLVFKFISIASNVEFIKDAKNSFEISKKLNQRTDTYTTRTNMYRIGIRYYDSISDHKKVIETAEHWEKYLHLNPHFIQNVRIGEINLNKLNSALHLRDYELGSVYAAKCSTLFNSGSANWLIFLEYYFLLALHSNNTPKAIEVFNDVTKNKSFNKYSTSTLEKWKIFEAFLHYTLPESKENNRKFSTAKFINEVPIFSKDKAGYNLSIIIAQVILLIKAGEFEKVVEKAEALKLYAARYIKKDKSPRSYYFIKMLLVMIKYDFNPAKTEEIAEKFFVKLKATHMGEQNQLETLEVIPYDLLWQRLLDQLRQK